jgi:hypothetical protein
LANQTNSPKLALFAAAYTAKLNKRRLNSCGSTANEASEPPVSCAFFGVLRARKKRQI